MTPGPGHNMAAMALEKIRYSSFAMSSQHRAHLLGFTKMKVLAGMSDAKHGLYAKEIGSLLIAIKHTKYQLQSLENKLDQLDKDNTIKKLKPF